MALPLPLRNRLAGLILRALSDRASREELRAWAGSSGDVAEPHAAEARARARRAARMLDRRPLAPAKPALADALESAGDLFNARLYFEVHELLEPHWVLAAGREREAIQGLIQGAVALEHLANGNIRGAQSLLAEAVRKLRGRELAGLALEPFARGLAAALQSMAGADATAQFDWSAVPRFPGTSGAEVS
jgi:hypothetical protein